MIHIIILAFIFLLPFNAGAVTVNPEASIVKANDLYKNGKYSEAIEILETIEGQGYKNGHVFYNLGNAYYRTGKIGKAILNYKKARKLIPRDEDLQANFDYVRQQLKDQIESEKSSPFQVLFFWIHLGSFHEFLILFLSLNALLFLLFTLHIYKKSAVLKRIIFFTAIIYLFSLISVYSRYTLEKGNDHGVVMSEEINVRSGSSLEAITLFKLHEGADFKIEEVKNGWLKILLHDGKKGWVEEIFVNIY